MKPTKCLSASLLMLLLSGCLSLGDSSELRVYAPDTRITANSNWRSTPISLSIATPISSDALDTARIVVRPQADVMNVYAGATWAEPIPNLLQNSLVRAFEDSAAVTSVGRQGDGLRSDHLLMLDIRHFESVYANDAKTPEVLIEVHAKLLSSANNKSVATRTFRVNVPAQDKEVPAVVSAFEQALKNINAEIITWTLDSAKK